MASPLKNLCPSYIFANIADCSDLFANLAKREEPTDGIENTVKEILKNVQIEGDSAVVHYTQQFDCPAFSAPMLKVAEQTIADSIKEVTPQNLAAINAAIKNIQEFHQAQKERSFFQPSADGTILGQVVRPVDSAGLYVPGGIGGETPLISSLLMNAIPAQVAGVENLIVISPPRKDGTLNPHILAAAHLLGITSVFMAGSAWGIAALAYGTQTIPQVDIIAGPGNIYVTTAKRLLIGQVGIDMIAGPSEILVIADEQANPAWIAADLLAQAEHDACASSILLCTNTQIIEAVQQELEKQVQTLPRKEIALKSLADWSGLCHVPSLELACAIANHIAPEHLELCVATPWDLVGKIKHAGAIFLGNYTPESLGDYFAGPNHVLPTLRTARFSSGLSVQTFCKKTNIIAASAAFTNNASPMVASLARLEALEAHARAIEIRTNHSSNK